VNTYAVLIYEDESYYSDVTSEAWAAMMDAHGAFAKAVAEQGGVIVGGEALQPTATATSLRRGGAPTDGPFAETKESLGGFYLIQARDLDHVLALAALCPAPAGGVEVRPILDTSAAASPA
jgi:hypothetical protein